MVTYFDSNVILSLIKNDVHSAIAKKIWNASTDKVSSILLEAECFIVLRRLFLNNKDKVVNFEAELEAALSSMHLRVMDYKITEIVRNEKKLAGCRSLDALHLATALYYKSQGPDDFFIATFDKGMADLAKKLGFSVLDFEN